MKRYKVLLSDDNTGLFQTLSEIAHEEAVELICCSDWETAKSKLLDNFDDYHSVILDGKGKLNDATKDANARHLSVATKWLAEESVKGNYIPVVVYTGYYDNIAEFQGVDSQVLRIFQKGDNIGSSFKNLLTFLKSNIENSERQKFISAYPTVYAFAKKYLKKNNRELLLKLGLMLKEKSPSFTWRKSALDYLRLSNEALVDTIPIHYYNAPFSIDDYVAKIKREGNVKANSGNRAISIIEHLDNNVIRVPEPIIRTVKNIYLSASAYAAHNSESQDEYYPSVEMIMGLTYSHFGCYHWFNQIINK
jgi:hypothetical protein